MPKDCLPDRIDIVIDSDAANETDDQFAIALALMAAERFQIRAMYAAQFLHVNVYSRGEGMQASYRELLRLLTFFPGRDIPCLPGAAATAEQGGVSAAAWHLVELSRQYDALHRLKVVAIAALTNIAGAILLDPTICERIELWWLGGQLYENPPEEFNLCGDLAAVKIVFDSMVPIVMFPCAGVAQQLILTREAAETHLAAGGVLGAFLFQRFRRAIESWRQSQASLWDIAPFATLLEPAWAELVELPRRKFCPKPLGWRHETAGTIRMCRRLAADQILADFFRRLAAYHAAYPGLTGPDF